MTKAPAVDVGDVPVYNEAERDRARSSPRSATALEARGGEWEIIVVDNASDDDTAERLQPFLEDPRIRLLRNEHNRGKGYSVRRGMLEATGDLRLMCDADCAPSLVSLPAMEAMIGRLRHRRRGAQRRRARRSGATSRCSAAPPAWASSSCAAG